MTLYGHPIVTVSAINTEFKCIETTQLYASIFTGWEDFFLMYGGAKECSFFAPNMNYSKQTFTPNSPESYYNKQIYGVSLIKFSKNSPPDYGYQWMADEKNGKVFIDKPTVFDKRVNHPTIQSAYELARNYEFSN